MKTYDRDTFQRARQAWDEGEYGDEWDDLRRISWERGYPYPPNGTWHDDPDAPEPSQRALIHQWLEYRPSELALIARRCRSWSDVVRQVVSMRQRVEEDADYAEKDAEWERAARPTRDQAVESLRSIMGRLP